MQASGEAEVPYWVERLREKGYVVHPATRSTGNPPPSSRVPANRLRVFWRRTLGRLRRHAPVP